MITARIVIALTFVIAGQAAHAATDVLLRAVGFAVIGSDAAKVVVVDLKNCIFKVDNQIYYFNNMYSDRITFQNVKNGMDETWTNVGIHGNKTVVDLYSEGATFRGTELDYRLKAANPRLFQPSSHSHADFILRVNTREPARLVKAWQYIFANGCKGTRSPF